MQLFHRDPSAKPIADRGVQAKSRSAGDVLPPTWSVRVRGTDDEGPSAREDCRYCDGTPPLPPMRRAVDGSLSRSGRPGSGTNRVLRECHRGASEGTMTRQSLREWNVKPRRAKGPGENGSVDNDHCEVTGVRAPTYKPLERRNSTTSVPPRRNGRGKNGAVSGAASRALFGNIGSSPN